MNSARPTVPLEDYERLKKEFEESIVSLNKAYEEKLRHERELRTKLKEQLKYLQDQVLNLGRELQRRNEQNSGYPITSVYSTGLPPLPRDSTVPTFSSGREDTSSSGGKPTNNTV